jgi:hypothetical protein
VFRKVSYKQLYLTFRVVLVVEAEGGMPTSLPAPPDETHSAWNTGMRDRFDVGLPQMMHLDALGSLDRRSRVRFAKGARQAIDMLSDVAKKSVKPFIR